MNSFHPFDWNSEERFRDLFDNANDLIHFAEPDGTLRYVNRAWMNLLGYPMEEIIGRSIYSFVHESSREKFRQYREALLAGKDNLGHILITVINKAGGEIRLEGSVSAKFNEGQPIYTRGIFRDVTAKLESEARLKKYYEELKEREDNLHQLLVHAPDAIIVINREGKITFWNPKAEEIFGWNYEEVLGRNLSQTIIPPQHRTAHEQGMKRFLETGEARVLNKTIEITALNRRREEFYVALTISSTIQNGETAFIGFLRDITVQKKNEIELERKTRQLESSNKELEHFAHVASHDMKEPIRKVKLFTERVQSEFGASLPAKAKTFLNKVQEAANRLGEMVEGVLNHSRMAGIAEPYETIHLAAILASIETDLELLIREKQARIEYRDFPVFEGIPFLIYQLFYNLVNNSLKFAKKDTHLLITISGELVEEEAEGWHFQNKKIRLQLRDNGIGFSQKFSEKIFQAFARLHNRHEYEGTGLGLALCKNIVERHKGVITAEGHEGAGALFTIILPVKQQ